MSTGRSRLTGPFLDDNPSWPSGIYELQTDDPVLGGPDGIDNWPLRSLTERSVWLKAQIEAVIKRSGRALDLSLTNQLDLAIVALIAAAIAPKAPLASPVLTGIPTAPTAAVGTNTTQIASTAFVQAALTALVNAAPGALDTLRELSSALGNDPNFAATMAATLALKAPLVSPTLTGKPTAPTATVGTNTTQIASTAFVQATINALISTAPGTLSTLKELAAAIGNDPNFATNFSTALTLKAPLDSPVFTGTPRAPTATVGTNNTQLASTAFVHETILALIDGAPEKLNTLKELAAAIGNDRNFATNFAEAMAGALELKAPLISPVFTGTPRAPTATVGTNTTQIASTAFVHETILALIDGAPETLNTLKELAAALGNDPNFAATMAAALALKAPLDSPVLTGNPAAPTAPAGTSTTQLATTAFVQAAIAAMVDAAPGALNTLNELAAALGDNPNFATTMTNALALKAPLASPALTGTPTAPTAAVGTNSNQLASTAFVQAAILALIAGAPATLNTLDSLAASIGDDPNFATTMINALALKAPLSSPVFAGTPRAPTATVGTNTTQIASTAFVHETILALIAGAPAMLNNLKELAAAIGDDPNFAATMADALALKAPLDSPVLTGNPAAPTAAVGTSTTQLATTAFVQAAIAALVNAAPGALNTLKELAAAIGDDPNFAATMAAALALKAPLDSPVLTGNPAAPTAPAGTSTTQLATTAFVQAAIAAMVDAAPGTINTLNELAAALGDNPNFATTMTNALALKAPLSSPVLTGIPTAPTAAVGTSTSQLASTAFVQAAMVNSAHGYHRGLKVQVTSSTGISISADELVLADNSAKPKTKISVSETIAANVSGAGGIDVGSVSGNTWYHVWVIDGFAGTVAMLSLSATDPTLPSGYTHKIRVGAVRTNGSGNLIETRQCGRRAQYVSGGINLPSCPKLASGSATWPKAVAVSATVPATATAISLVLAPGKAGGYAYAGPNDNAKPEEISAYTEDIPLLSSFYTSSAVAVGSINFLLESRNIYYGSTLGTASLYCMGWEDSI